jgi:hypothetical protein
MDIIIVYIAIMFSLPIDFKTFETNVLEDLLIAVKETLIKRECKKHKNNRLKWELKLYKELKERATGYSGPNNRSAEVEDIKEEYEKLDIKDKYREITEREHSVIYCEYRGCENNSEDIRMYDLLFNSGDYICEGCLGDKGGFANIVEDYIDLESTVDDYEEILHEEYMEAYTERMLDLVG